MTFRNIIFSLIVLLTIMCNSNSDFEEYQKLKNIKTISIKKEDLPREFSGKAYDTVLDFIEKTRGLNNEWLLYFDYITGEILRCVKGECDNVSLDFEEFEFDGHCVASIHNHPNNVLSPPSGKNFGILKRDFEDYELVAGFEYFWIFKAKGLHEDLIVDINNASEAAFISSFLHCTARYGEDEVFNRMQDIRYGAELSKYINNKNINDIQLIKKEYDTMVINSKTATYNCRRRITDPEVIKFARDFENNPFTPTGRDIMYAFYKSVGMDVSYDEIFAD